MGRIKPLIPEVPARTLQSEETLMLAVLEQAISDLGHHSPAVRADAEAYFFHYGPESSVFSFDAVCGQFHLSQSAIRRQLRAKGTSIRLALSAMDRKAA